MLNKPHILTIKVFTVGDVPPPEAIDAMLSHSDYNVSLLSMEASPMKFDGVGLVPIKAPATATPKEDEPKRKLKSSPAPKAPSPKPIVFTPGSDAEKVWLVLRDGPALTSTQIREKTGLASGIVNTTLYRLRGADMVRLMSYKAPNGDSLYTATIHDNNKKE